MGFLVCRSLLPRPIQRTQSDAVRLGCHKTTLDPLNCLFEFLKPGCISYVQVLSVEAFSQGLYREHKVTLPDPVAMRLPWILSHISLYGFLKPGCMSYAQFLSVGAFSQLPLQRKAKPTVSSPDSRAIYAPFSSNWNMKETPFQSLVSYLCRFGCLICRLSFSKGCLCSTHGFPIHPFTMCGQPVPICS